MHIEYYESTDSAYISLKNNERDEIVHTDSFKIDDIIQFSTINLDFNEDNKLIGIEIFFVSKIFTKEILAFFKNYSQDKTTN